MPPPEDVHTAHCVVGEARSFASPCVPLSIAKHFIGRFPGRQSVFAHFSVAPENATGELDLKLKAMPCEACRGPSGREGQQRLRAAVQLLPHVVHFSESVALLPACLRQRNAIQARPLPLSA